MNSDVEFDLEGARGSGMREERESLGGEENVGAGLFKERRRRGGELFEVGCWKLVPAPLSDQAINLHRSHHQGELARRPLFEFYVSMNIPYPYV